MRITQQQLEAMTLIELKALGYDMVIEMENVQKGIGIVNQLIFNKSQSPIEVKPEILKGKKP